MSNNKIKKYIYNFGIDSINFSNVNINNDTCFISNEINLEYNNCYIQLLAEYDEGDNGSIEFYIIDGSEEKAILPLNQEKVFNEKIFSNLKTRFTIDESQKIIIKKDGVLINTNFEQAQKLNESNLTISYTPINAHNIKIKNKNIRVKIIMRTYDNKTCIPYVKKINIRKYKGEYNGKL